MTITDHPDVADVVDRALAEDLGVDVRSLASEVAIPDLLSRDVTSAAAIPAGARQAGDIVARECCVIAGLPVAAEVFRRLSSAAQVGDPVTLSPLVEEGDEVEPGTAIARVEGSVRVMLAAERTALDFLMVLSGIATETARWVAAAGPMMEVCDTRKTIPGLRVLSKYAVRMGGGSNHRAGLHDMVLIKDNHLAFGLSIPEAIAAARANTPDLEVEVEADSCEQAVLAVESGADAVLLDNMSGAVLERAVSACRESAIRRGRPVVLEASGGITIGRLPALSAAGVDRLSTSALSFARPVDLALDAFPG